MGLRHYWIQVMATSALLKLTPTPISTTLTYAPTFLHDPSESCHSELLISRALKFLIGQSQRPRSIAKLTSLRKARLWVRAIHFYIYVLLVCPCTDYFAFLSEWIPFTSRPSTPGLYTSRVDALHIHNRSRDGRFHFYQHPTRHTTTMGNFSWYWRRHLERNVGRHFWRVCHIFHPQHEPANFQPGYPAHGWHPASIYINGFW